MSSSIQTILNECALKVLRPLIRVMARNDTSCSSFEELVRKAYVDEAFSTGKTISKENLSKITVSSVSAQTGLSHEEVKRLNDLVEEKHAEIEQKYNQAIRVISGWLNDKKYTDASGNAKILSIDGQADSFAELVKQFSGDIPGDAMLELLIAADCVKVTQNTVQLIKHAYIPAKDPTEIVRILGADTNELISTIDHNLTASKNDKRFQRKVSTAVLNKNAIEEFKKLSNNHSQALLEELDNWLVKNEVEPDNENACYVSLGIYYYEQ